VPTDGCVAEMDKTRKVVESVLGWSVLHAVGNLILTMRPLPQVRRVLSVAIISALIYSVFRDWIAVKWGVQRHAESDDWPWLVFHYAIMVQAAFTLMVGIGISPIARALSSYPRAARKIVIVYYFSLGMLLGCWLTLTRILAKG
jgi:hypothetical protein